MIKNLVKHGNSHAMVIDRTIMDLLQASPETPLKVTIEGTSLRITPQRHLQHTEGDRLYDDEIELSDSDGGCPWRTSRMEHVIGYVQGLADHYGNPKVLNKVASLQDWKGDLTVAWREEPTEGEKELFLRAWTSRIGDGADNVHHEMAS